MSRYSLRHVGNPLGGLARESAATPLGRGGVFAAPGGSAQPAFERRKARHRAKLRAALPLIVAATVVIMAAAFFAIAPHSPPLAAVGSIAAGVLSALAITALPPEAMFWERGARGERRTADSLRPLREAGFITLHDRRRPGSRANIDHIAIGPTGVFVIETRNLKGTVEVVDGRIFVGGRPRQGFVAEVYREALATQTALGEALTPLRLTVTPVLCIHGARLPRSDQAVDGVRLVSAQGLRRLVEERPTVLDAEQVLALAELADRRLRAPHSWEVATPAVGP